jgi:hypothetical protein
MLKSIFFLFKELLVNLLKGYKGQKEWGVSEWSFSLSCDT